MNAASTFTSSRLGGLWTHILPRGLPAHPVGFPVRLQTDGNVFAMAQPPSSGPGAPVHHRHQPVDDDLETFMRHRAGMHDGRLRPLTPSEPTTFAALAYLNWIVTPGTLVIRRAVASAVGGFDGELTPADDWDTAVRVSRRGDVGYVDRPLLRWRRHADALSYASPAYGRAHLMVRHKMLIDRTNTRSQLRAARQGYAHTTRELLGGATRWWIARFATAPG